MGLIGLTLYGPIFFLSFLIIIIIIILFEYHYKKVQSSTKCMGIQYTPAMVDSDIKARK